MTVLNASGYRPKRVLLASARIKVLGRSGEYQYVGHRGNDIL